MSQAESIKGGLAGALARGESAKAEWIRAGDLVPAKQLADAWGLTRRALGPAERRGELFVVTVRRKRFYPREFLQQSREDVAAVCRELVGLTPVEQLFFWKRKHGALKGKTVPQVLAEHEVARVVKFARLQTAQMRSDVVSTPEGARIMQLATSALGDETIAHAWLARPAYGLNGAIPMELMATADGRAQVLELLGRLDAGVYS